MVERQEVQVKYVKGQVRTDDGFGAGGVFVGSMEIGSLDDRQVNRNSMDCNCCPWGKWTPAETVMCHGLRGGHAAAISFGSGTGDLLSAESMTRSRGKTGCGADTAVAEELRRIQVVWEDRDKGENPVSKQWPGIGLWFGSKKW